MSPITPGGLPGDIAGASMIVNENKSGQSRVATTDDRPHKQQSQRCVSGMNDLSPSTDHSVAKEVDRNVRISSTQSYIVPQLREPPRRNNLSHDTLDRDLPIDESKGSLNAQVAPFDALSVFRPAQNNSSMIFSGPASSSTASSSFTSFRDSPLTPWENYQPSPTQNPFSTNNLRPTASAFTPPCVTLNSPTCLLDHGNNSNFAKSPGAPSAKSSFSRNDPNSLVGLGISSSETGSPVKSLAEHPTTAVNAMNNDDVPNDSNDCVPSVSRSAAAAVSLSFGGFSPIAIGQSPPRRYSQLSSFLEKRRQILSPEDTNQTPCTSAVRFSPSSSHSILGSTSPVTTQATDVDTVCLARDVSNCSDLEKGDSSTSSPSPIRTVLALNEPEIWEERQQARSFKKQRLENTPFEEIFESAFDVLSTLNPDQYQMPRGSRVVCIKTSSVTNIILSLKNGIWACPHPVSDRIKEVWAKRVSDDEKILLLFSVPGSKHFCGIAEITDFLLDDVTDIWDSGVMHTGTMILHWIFCKLVPYDEVKKNVERSFPEESATQMWNGMHYSDSIGREVVKSFVQFPHMDNLLVKHKVSHELSLNPKRGALNPPRDQHGDLGHSQNRSASSRGNHSGCGGSQSGREVLITPKPASPIQNESQKISQPSTQIVLVCAHENSSAIPAGSTKSAPASPFDKIFTPMKGDTIMTAPLPSIPSPRFFQKNTGSPDAHHLSRQSSLKFESSETMVQTPVKQAVHIGVPETVLNLGEQADVGESQDRAQVGSLLQLQTPTTQIRIHPHAASLPPSGYSKSSDSLDDMSPTQRMQRFRIQPNIKAKEPSMAEACTHASHMNEFQTQNTCQTPMTPSFPSFPLFPAGRPMLPPDVKITYPGDQTTLSPSQGSGQVGHHSRSSTAESSVDMRMTSMVDDLVRSPALEAIDPEMTEALNELNNLSET